MGATILKLVVLFDRCAPDPDIQSDLRRIVADHDSWGTAHAYRDIVRERMLRTKDDAKIAQYAFAESCFETIYNETEPIDPFNSVCPFWVVPRAAALAKLVGISTDSVLRAAR
jgi:hypothetical protein